MHFERIYDNDLAQASYFIGCQATGEAIVIDPRRDITEYLDLAATHDLRIAVVTETHIHADYLSGTRELAQATGAQIAVSGEGGEDWQYGFEARRLHDRDRIELGNLTIQARHTPGHTPEHLAFLVTDGAFSDEPGYLISGDFVFVGDLGRPDLLDAAAGGVDTRFGGARALFASLRDVFLELPDHVQVHPGHGAGSACGKALGSIPSTTVGYERRFAWWSKYLAANDEQGFVDELLAGQPDAHAYFARMKRQNKQGPAILGPIAPIAELEQQEVVRRAASGEAVIVDTRCLADAQQTVAGALRIPGPDKAATYGAWAFDPELDDSALILFAPDGTSAQRVRDHLLRVGIDNVIGYTSSLEGLPITAPQRIRPEDLDGFPSALVLDVRNKTEHSAGRIPDSTQISAGRVLWHLDELPERGTIVTYCQSGVRSAVAASALRRAGYDVVELEGSYAGWSAWQHAGASDIR